MAGNREERVPRRSDRPFYGNSKKGADWLLKSALERYQITESDLGLIAAFIREVKARGGITDRRAGKLASILIGWRRFVGSYHGLTITDLYHGITLLRARTKGELPYYSQNTLRDYISLLKRFHIWLVKHGYSVISIDLIREIKVPPINKMTVNAAQILTEADVIAMIRACESSRDRALVSVLYEAAFRIQELASLTWSQVQFDAQGVRINVMMKTDKPTYKRLIAATPYLAAWKNDYPFEPEGDAVVFVTRQRQPIQYEGVARQLRQIAARAGITKRVRPHLFRHSRITHLQQRGVSDAVIKQTMWGHPGSKMLETYSHLSDQDIDQALFTMNGIKLPTGAESGSFTARICPTCSTLNGPTMATCSGCGQPLT